MKTYLALVRHGSTDWNYDGRAQGQTDIPLNAEGRRQAESVAERLATERWDALYSSGLNRALATGEAIGRRTGHTPVVDPRLRERAMGVAEGTTALERQVRWPGVAWESLPGVESVEAVARRAREVLTDLASRHPGQRVIVVSHGSFILNFVRSLNGAPADLRVPRNTGIVPVLFDGREFTLAGPPDHRHLLVDGIEYTGEKTRVLNEARRSGLPGLRLEPSELEPFVLNATAVESAWSGDQMVGLARAFTDKVRCGYIDVLTTLPEFARVRSMLLERLRQRFPAVRFDPLYEEAEPQSSVS